MMIITNKHGYKVTNTGYKNITLPVVVWCGNNNNNISNICDSFMTVCD